MSNSEYILKIEIKSPGFWLVTGKHATYHVMKIKTGYLVWDNSIDLKVKNPARKDGLFDTFENACDMIDGCEIAQDIVDEIIAEGELK